MALTPEHAARVLGLVGQISLDDVKHARRELTLKYHPDRCRNASRATRHMARINAAVDTLIAHLRTRQVPPSCGPEPDAAADTTAETTADAARDRAHHKTDTMTGQRENAGRRDPPGPFASRCTPRPEARDTRRKARAEGTGAAGGVHRGAAKMAATSYRATLDRIGRQTPRASVDVQVLKFPESD
ncbi:MAG: J domain-containing protein [Pseudomonadota bacterium]